jgi:hypothetical protein
MKRKSSKKSMYFMSYPLCSFVTSLVYFVVKFFYASNYLLSSFYCINLLILLSINQQLSGQEIKNLERITSIAEELAADEENTGNADLFADILSELADNPVRINSGDENEISRLFFLNDFQVKVLADYINTTGKILSPFEIANIPGFDREMVEMILPFITFSTKSVISPDSLRFHHNLLTNFLFRTTEHDTSLAGSPWKNLIKYKLSAAGFTAGFTSEKDPGEKFLSGNPPMPDFFSGYLSYEGHNIIKHIILGDFTVRFGQGSNINTGMRTGLSLTTPGYMSGKNDIKPCTSADENNFFRGLAAEFAYGKFDLSLFMSVNKIDATLNNATDSTSATIETFYKTGLHNTKASLLKKDAVTENSFGANLSWNTRYLRTGVNFKETIFSLPFLPLHDNLMDIYDFTGRKNVMFSVYYNALLRRFILFGEFSTSGFKKNAFVQGVSIKPADRMNINFLFRSYSPGFVSFHGNGPSGGSVNSNEYGILANFTLETARYLFISAGYDLRYSPWIRYRCSSPSMAKKCEIRIKYLPSQKFSFETLLNYRYSMVDNEDENKIPGQNEITVRSVRGSAKYSPTEYLTFITRADYKLAEPSASRGFSLLQDINIKLKRLPVSIWTRYCIFSTDGFESAIYTWENDLLNTPSIPGLYGTGNRAYLMASWKITGKAEVRLKYGVTSTAVINRRMKDLHEFRIQLKIMI